MNGLRISTDLLAGALVGLVLGLYLDKFFGTKHVFLVICVLLGFAAGFKNILRDIRRGSKNEGA